MLYFTRSFSVSSLRRDRVSAREQQQQQQQLLRSLSLKSEDPLSDVIRDMERPEEEEEERKTRAQTEEERKTRAQTEEEERKTRAQTEEERKTRAQTEEERKTSAQTEEEERETRAQTEEERKTRAQTEEEERKTRAQTEEERKTRAQTEEEERKTRAQTEEEEEGVRESGVDEDDQASDGDDEQDNKDMHAGDDDDGKGTAAMKKSKQRGTSCPDRKCAPGILYLGHIPPRFRPKHLRNLLSPFGEIGRIFLQPEDGAVRSRKRRSGLRRCDFTEGWVEFRDKRVAKRVAASLHNTPMGTRKRQRFSSDLWSMKYLHRFQWTHLSERLAYEQTVLQQRLRTEVSQAKRETNFYLNNVEKSAHLRRKRQRDGQQVEERTWDFTQRQTEEEIQMKKKKRKDSVTQKHLDKTRLIQQKSQSNVSLLAKIFNPNTE